MKQLRLAQLVLVVFLGLTLVIPAVVNAQTAEREKMRQRLEQLFIWKVSDKLQLSPDKESKLASGFKRLSEEKTQLSQSLDDISDQMDKAKSDDKKLTKLLSEFRVAQKKYNDSQSKELEVVGKILNNKQLAEYVLLKRDMFHKFRDVLSTTGSSKTADNLASPTPLKKPEVFQEK